MEMSFSRYIKKHPLSAWLAFFLWLIISACASYLSFSSVHNQALQRFGYESRDIANAISERMSDYELALRSGKALFDASDEVTRNDWRHFADTIQLQKYFPGIQALGYSEMVSAELLATHIQETRLQGFPDYNVRPIGQRQQYSSIVYIEPFDWRNQRAFGFDMFSEPVRRKAMELARDTNQAAATGRVILVQETEQAVQYGFLMYVPVYHHDKTLSFVEDRRKALKGFVYSAFRIKDLMQGILGMGQDQLNFEIYDAGVNDGGLLYNNSSDDQLVFPERASLPGFKQTYELKVAGRPWRLFVYSRDGFMTLSERYLPVFIGIISTVLGIFLFYFISFLTTERNSAQRQAVNANQQNEALTQHLELAVNAANLGLMAWDLHTDKVYLDNRMLFIYGFKPDEFQGSYDEWKQIIHPDDRDGVLMDLAKASQFEERFDLSYRVIANNAVRYVHSSFSVERDATDNPARVVGFTSDVTELRLADTQLREKKWYLETVLEGAKLGSWEWNMQTGDAVFDERWAEMMGYKLSELMPTTIDTWKKYCHPDDYLAAEEQLERYFQGETDYFEITIRMRHRNGSWKYFLSRGKLFSRTDEGKPLMMFGTHQEITK